jgi:hypothetical protein
MKNDQHVFTCCAAAASAAPLCISCAAALHIKQLLLTERQFSVKLSFVCYACTIIAAYEWPPVLFSAGVQSLYSGACSVACALTTYRRQPEADDMAVW